MMTRVMIIAAAIALAIPTAAPCEVDLAWTTSIKVGEWIQVSQTTDGAAFVREPIVRPNGFRRAWVRVEAKPGSLPHAMSAMSLDEFDCAERRSRTLQHTFFQERNMGGKATTGTETDPWSFPLPGTMGGAVMKYVCAE